jgi:hypothetical protein
MKYPIAVFTLLSALVCQAQQGSDPKELSSLRDSYTKAKAAAVAPIDKKYVDALLGLKDKFTKAGNLEAAIATDAELKRIGSANPAPLATGDLPAAAGKTSRSRKLYGELVGTTWHTEWGDQTIVLEVDGLMRFSTEANNRQWRISNDGEMEMFHIDDPDGARNTNLTEKLDEFTIPFGTAKVCRRIVSPKTQ